MPAAQRTFAYRARDLNGALVTGTVVAASADEVGSQLRQDGKYVLGVSEHALTAAPPIDREGIMRGETAKRVRRDDVIAFAQQLGVMMETGVPLAEALKSFREQTTCAHFNRVLGAIENDIHAGQPFSAAMARWPRVFPSIMISLMKASEASGTMASMLSRVGVYLSKERRTAKQIKGALSYPAFMLIIGVALTVFLVAVVLPKFAKIYEQRSASLPLPTKVLLAISDFLTGSFLYYGPVVLVVGVLMAAWLHQPGGRRAVDWMRLRAPVLRRLYGQLYLTRASRTMATLLSAGVGLLDIIDICRGVTANHQWSRVWDGMDRQIRNGQQMSAALAGSPIIPANVVSMVAAGEKSGRLADVMERIAEFADEELDMTVKQTTTFIEPVMICLMGAVIGGVALALLLPIFTIGNVMTGH